MIEAQPGPWAAIAPVIENGNPATRISWANFTLGFIEWFAPDQSKPTLSCPGHNTCYKRTVLLEYDTDLETWLNPERVLHLEFVAKGRPMLLNKNAVTHHVNISLARSHLAQSFLGGRVFGASRAAHWPRGKTLLYAAVFPLVPFIRFRRILKHLNTPAKRLRAHLWAALSWTAAGFSAMPSERLLDT